MSYQQPPASGPYGQPGGYGPPPQTRNNDGCLKWALFGCLAVLVLGIGGCVTVGGLTYLGIRDAIDAEQSADAQPGGADNPMEITETEAFSVREYDYADGWFLRADPTGNATVRGLRVTNTGGDPSVVAVEIKLWRDDQHLATIDCSSADLLVEDTVKMDCTSVDQLPRRWDRITINDKF